MVPHPPKIVTASTPSSRLGGGGSTGCSRGSEPDGALGDPADGYKTYRALWALGLAGEVEAAHRVAGWYRRNALLADGRIGGPFRTQLDGWAYRDSAMIVGAPADRRLRPGLGLLPELLAAPRTR